jgi:hypothetical protein
MTEIMARVAGFTELSVTMAVGNKKSTKHGKKQKKNMTATGTVSHPDTVYIGKHYVFVHTMDFC